MAQIDSELNIGRVDNPSRVDEFNSLYDENHQWVIRYANQILGNDQDAEDATQEVFIAAWEAVSDGRLVWEARKGLLGILTRNKSIDVARTRRKIVSLTSENSDVPDIDVPSDYPDDHPPASFERRELRQNVQQGLAQLPFTVRQAVAMHIHGRVSTAEVARELGVPITTVESRIHSGYSRLRPLLVHLREAA